MLNPFYMSAGIWSLALIFYFFNWSDLNREFVLGTTFIFLNVLLCLIIGFASSAKFKFKREDVKNIRVPKGIDYIAILFSISVFVYIGQIPLVSYLNGIGTYGEYLDSFKNFSIIPVVLSVICTICFTCLIIEYFTKRDYWKLFRSFIYLSYPLLMLQRGTVFIDIYIFLSSWFVINQIKVNIKSVLVLAFVVVVSLYFFGVAGNIRSGYEWSDSSYIFKMGLFNDNFPDWLPKQFCWFYTYITSPLANVNFTATIIQNDSVSVAKLLNYIYNFLPLGLSKRLPGYEVSDGFLIVPWLNATSIYGGYCETLGGVGIFLGALIQIFMVLFGWSIVNRSRYKFHYCLFVSIVMIFSFFTNSFSYPLMSYPVIAVMLLALIEKSKK